MGLQKKGKGSEGVCAGDFPDSLQDQSHARQQSAFRMELPHRDKPFAAARLVCDNLASTNLLIQRLEGDRSGFAKAFAGLRHADTPAFGPK